MKTLRKNAYKVTVVPFYKREELKDKSGYANGEYKLLYRNPITLLASISASKSVAESEMFGTEISFDKVLIFNKVFDIKEHDLIFIDKECEYNEDTKEVLNKDYIIKKIAKSKNVLSVAVKKND